MDYRDKPSRCKGLETILLLVLISKFGEKCNICVSDNYPSLETRNMLFECFYFLFQFLNLLFSPPRLRYKHRNYLTYSKPYLFSVVK